MRNLYISRFMLSLTIGFFTGRYAAKKICDRYIVNKELHLNENDLN